MANTNPWWVIWSNDQPIKGVGTTGNTFQGTKAQAQAQANTTIDGTITGPYSTEALALAAIKAAGGNGSGSKTPNPPAGPQQPINPTGSLDDFLEFPEKVLAWISNRENMVRVVKVIVGSVMILTGLDMLAKDTTGINPAGAVKNAAGNVAKIAK